MRIILNIGHRIIRSAKIDRAAKLYVEAALTLAEAHATVLQKGRK
jgi:hypothetical protein